MDIYPTRNVSEPALIFRRDPVVYGGPEEGPFEEQDLKGFAADGFRTVDGLLGAADIERFRAEFHRLSADDRVRRDGRTVLDPESGEVRTIVDPHKVSELFAELAGDSRLVDRARQLLGSEVYVHQSRFDDNPGFDGEDFYWHSDFETWHAEDGMPRMRAVSVSIALADNDVCTGGLMIMPGSHRTFVSCLGDASGRQHWDTRREYEVGTPDPDSLTMLANKYGIEMLTVPAGSATMFDCNCMYGANGNITPFPRSNIFIVFNSVQNTSAAAQAPPARRPEPVKERDFTAVG